MRCFCEAEHESCLPLSKQADAQSTSTTGSGVLIHLWQKDAARDRQPRALPDQAPGEPEGGGQPPGRSEQGLLRRLGDAGGRRRRRVALPHCRPRRTGPQAGPDQHRFAAGARPGGQGAGRRGTGTDAERRADLLHHHHRLPGVQRRLIRPWRATRTNWPINSPSSGRASAPTTTRSKASAGSRARSWTWAPAKRTRKLREPGQCLGQPSRLLSKRG